MLVLFRSEAKRSEEACIRAGGVPVIWKISWRNKKGCR